MGGMGCRLVSLGWKLVQIAVYFMTLMTLLYVMGKVRLTSETEFLYDERRSRTESVYVLDLSYPWASDWT